MIVANLATDELAVFRYKPDMAKSTRFTSSEPASHMNQWVRDAIEYADISITDLAREMDGRGLPTSYDRSKVQKMTVARRVTMEEARVISEITGYPTLEGDETAPFLDKYRKLSEADRTTIRHLVNSLHARHVAGEK